MVSQHPLWVLAIAALLAGGAIAYTVANLGFEPDRNKLISQQLDWNQRFTAWQSSFPGKHDFLVVIDSWGTAGRPASELTQLTHQALAELAEKLQDQPFVRQVNWGFDPAGFSPRTLRMAPMDEFTHRLRQIEQAQMLLGSDRLDRFMGQVADSVSQADPTAMFDMRAASEGARDLAGKLRELTALAHPFTRAAARASAEADVAPEADTAADPARHASPAIVFTPDGQDDWRYLRSDNGRLYFVRITPHADEPGEGSYTHAVERTQALLREVAAGYPQLAMGLTGTEVVEADETSAAEWDAKLSSIIAFILIAILLMIAFHSVRTPLLAMVALLFGIAWTFGFLTVTIGHLQVISVVFAVILLGLGIAYGIHIASRFELIRHRHPDSSEGFAAALQQTLETVGPGVLTGALTTAAAFCTTMLTDYTGVAEMGLIAAAGVLLCLLAMITVFPAMMRLVKPHHAHVRSMNLRSVHLFEERWVMPFHRHPTLTLAAAALITLGSLVAALQLRFDFNLLNLQPTGVASVAWQHRIIEDGNQSIYYAVILADDLEQARELSRGLHQIPQVAAVRGIGLLFPHDEDQKLEMIRELRQRLRLEPGSFDGPPPALEASVQRITAQLRRVTQLPMPTILRQAMLDLRESSEAFTRTLADVPAARRPAMQARLNDRFIQWRQEAHSQIEQALDTQPLNLDDVPHALTSPYIGIAGEREGKFALEVHPSPGPEGALDPTFLAGFVGQLQQVDPAVTGSIVQIYRSGDLISRAYLKAGGVAMLLVMLLLVIDFGRASDAVLALVPVIMGFTVTFAILWVLGMHINLANVIVLPLMFGIGVDAGVHMIHRFRQEPNIPPLGLTDGTGKGITMTSLTAMLGFGAMMLASHRGIASLGFVMTLGIGLTLLACLFIMPPLLELLHHHRKQAQPQTSATQHTADDN